MEKVIFNDLLLKPIINGEITQFRKIVEPRKLELWGNEFVCDILSVIRGNETKIKTYRDMLGDLSNYESGDVLAIAQSYKSIALERPNPECYPFWSLLQNEAGWHDKIFVRPENMAHFIEIKGCRLSRLQDLSESDIPQYGIKQLANRWVISTFSSDSYDSPERAYTRLISEIFGASVVAENPVCVSYDFTIHTGQIPFLSSPTEKNHERI